MTEPAGIDFAAVRAYCDQRVPPHVLDQVRVEAIIDQGAVTIVERRPPWRADLAPDWTISPIARIRYSARDGV